VSVFLTDLEHHGLELPLEQEEWTVLLRLLSSLKIVDDETLSRWDGTARVEVRVEMARKIGSRLEQMFEDDVRASEAPPVIPNYIRPIATSNGLWIDPALPLLNRRSERDYFYLMFAHFCQTCSGFSIG
jgi:hypothetical protein